MSFSGKNPFFETILAKDENYQGLAVLTEEQKLLEASFVLATNTNPVFTGFGNDDLQVQNIGGFTNPDTVSYTVTIDGNGIGTVLLLSTEAEYIIGETVTGSISGVSAVVVGANIEARALYVDSNPGFIPGENITGDTSGTSVILDIDLGPYDTFSWADNESGSGTALPCGAIITLSNNVIINFSNYNGHIIGDVWTFEVSSQLKKMLELNGQRGLAALGEVGGDTNNVFVGVNIPQKMAAIGSQGSFITNRNNTFVVGLDDLNIFNEGSSLVNPPVLYSITITSEGTPDSFDWSDSNGNSEANRPIISGNMNLSYGVSISFDSDTGHTAGSTWAFTINEGFLPLVKAAFEDLRVAIGDAEGIYNGTQIEIDVPAGTATVTGDLIVPNGVTTPSLKSSTGVVLVNTDSGIYNDTGGAPAFFAPAGTTRTLNSANGTTHVEISNTQVNIPTQLRIVNSLEIVRSFKRVSQLRIVSYTLNATNDQSIQYIDASAGDITVTLPTASSSNRYATFLFKRIDSGVNNVTVQTTGGQFIDGATSFTLAPYEAKEIQCENIGVYKWHIIGSVV